jgi:hypothetical protein
MKENNMEPTFIEIGNVIMRNREKYDLMSIGLVQIYRASKTIQLLLTDIRDKELLMKIKANIEDALNGITILIGTEQNEDSKSNKVNVKLGDKVRHKRTGRIGYVYRISESKDRTIFRICDNQELNYSKSHSKAIHIDELELITD